MAGEEYGGEFDSVIDEEGKISMPVQLARRFASKKVRVRVSSFEISDELRKRNVTAEEIERIAGMQLESSGQAVQFLLSEGALSKNPSFVRRTRRTKL